ncbi:MAG TPA: polysaccharide deacetylase family protein [Candidatus Paceibacterota bacterium]
MKRAASFLIFSILGITVIITRYIGTASVAYAHTGSSTPAIPKEITIGDTTKKQVIFTFDCGDKAASVNGILAVLAKHHVKGTFFVTGTFAKTYPEFIRAMVNGGHEIFNHTYDHPHLTELPDWRITQELALLEQTVYLIAGTSTQPYFRPPYGDRDRRVRAAAARLGYRSVYWTTDARDWQETSGMTADRVKEKILNSMQPGAIYLMHGGDRITAAILDDVLTNVEQRGYKAVSLTQGL